MTPLGNNIIFRKQNTYASQRSSIIQTVEPEVAWMVEAVGPKVESLKIGDRIVIPSSSPKTIGTFDNKQLFMISEDDIIAVYTAK